MLKVKRNPRGIDVSGGDCSELYPLGMFEENSELVIYVTMTN